MPSACLGAQTQAHPQSLCWVPVPADEGDGATIHQGPVAQMLCWVLTV